MKTSTDATAATEASNTSTEAPNNGTIAVVDEASSPEAEAGCWPSARDGGLLCDPFFGYDAATFCDRATEWCFTNHGFGPTQCVSFGSTCAPYALVDACDSVFNWNAAACDAGDHRCACLSVNCSSGTCQEDDAGGITISCGSCYGAPPARLERLAA